MAVKFQSSFKSSQQVTNDFYTPLNYPFMLCQNFDTEYAAGEEKNFWFGGTITDSEFDASIPYNRFMCVADFYITQVQTYSTQIFNVGEEFILSFIGDVEGVLATCDITTPTQNTSIFEFDGNVNQPIQFITGRQYYMSGLNNQYANVFSLYQLTATAVSGYYQIT